MASIEAPVENLKNQLKEAREEARAQRATIVDLRNEIDRLKRKYLFLNAELNAIHGADRGDAETESRWLDMQLRVMRQEAEQAQVDRDRYRRLITIQEQMNQKDEFIRNLQRQLEEATATTQNN
ncbi:hypothetical protein GCK72_006980 [Caenorhabditis remanei]|uniref:Uncharacterized protein n=1 Tax=Caenorhabditis remanei TaxID=31234 RepID=A0A6A5HMI8_CAERE|nr:hypothetical protein GCK72_006980 [Caenorhabditis remanei]KAF1767022.1 hypothetical protein GCK72_006980 [Caenorhabditis remanei]